MHYSISEFAALTGVSERTLRYYHERGLLHPHVAANGYREFTSGDADTLQLIRFYTAAGFTLTAVADLLRQDAPARVAALREQRCALQRRQAELTVLIAQVDSTIANQEEQTMTDTEKFAAFKQDALRKNDEQYGEEVAARWGAVAKQEGDTHFANLDAATFARSQEVEGQLAAALRAALSNEADPASAAGQEVYALHREWLTIMWPHYTAAMHRGLADMYAADSRFTDYYDKLAGVGAGQWLIAAVRNFAR
ncbi:MerR family transcriptional regulator [Lacticaseibacillus hulanensis]|uniref:MerR family transcriptional regulator n=1 Tax=Lacticaseibacillus hulanensis TaxID=2493111 RepID=UPI0013E30820|nr:MerR family transcriptional regulator [Lacticaseibacillus hulanensis]